MASGLAITHPPGPCPTFCLATIQRPQMTGFAREFLVIGTEVQPLSQLSGSCRSSVMGWLSSYDDAARNSSDADMSKHQ